MDFRGRDSLGNERHHRADVSTDKPMLQISEAEKRFLVESADTNVRADGRGRLDYRCFDTL